MSYQPFTREQMAEKCARDLPDGAYVNVGVGIPLSVPKFIPADREIVFQSENGMLGMGPIAAPDQKDTDIVNAGRQYVTLVPGAAVFSHSDSFAMICGGHLDYALLGGFQVSATGDLANWSTDDAGGVPAIGGAMDLAAGAKQVWVLLEHTTKTGEPRILERCSYPLTAERCVTRIYTNLAVIDVTTEGLVVREMVDGLSLKELQGLTGATLRMAAA